MDLHSGEKLSPFYFASLPSGHLGSISFPSRVDPHWKGHIIHESKQIVAKVVALYKNVGVTWPCTHRCMDKVTDNVMTWPWKNSATLFRGSYLQPIWSKFWSLRVAPSPFR